MSTELIQYAFISGEVSERLYGRSDLEKFDFGVALAQNWFVDYRGGLSTRSGTEFIDFVMDDDKDTRFIPFQFSSTSPNVYALLFGDFYLRFIQDGAYVLETGQAIGGITQADPGVVTITAHGYSTGDWLIAADVGGMVELEGRTFEVGTTTANTFQLLDPFGNNVDTSGYTAWTTGGTFSRIYTVTTPYAAADVEALQYYQIFDTMRLTHPSYAIYNLTRVSATSWTLTAETIGNGGTSPSNVTITPSAAGSAGVAVAVTAIDADTGIESLASTIKLHETIVNFTSTAGSIKITWDAVTNAKEYKIYRSLVLATGTDITMGMELGYIGRAFGTQFVDNNIIPDFTATPPLHYNPFAHGSITHIDVTAKGTSYAKADTVSVSGGGGSGFVGFPIINTAGEIIGVRIVNGGAGYSSPTVSFGTSTGSGATATATLGATSGNYPAICGRFNQRMIYGATDNNPLRVVGGRPGELSNFDFSQIIVDDDSFDFEVDSNEVNPIRHLISARGGILLMTEKGIWQLSGGGVNSNTPITPTNALADPQSFAGISEVAPLTIENTILYVEGRGTTVRLLEYNEITKAYGGTDLSILSNHMFTATKQISRMDYASEPFRLVHAVRSDGTLLTFTIVKEQNVYGWTRNVTKGLYKDVVVVQEGVRDSVYYIVKRLINGRWTKFIERAVDRQFPHVEDAFCVDCGLRLPETYPAADLTIDASSGSGVTVTASASVFASGDVGKILRAGGGKMTVATYVSGTEITVNFNRDITAVIEEDPDETPLPVEEGDWTMDAKSTTITGLWHLEGETASILMDGNVISSQVITDGTITLATGATRGVVGIGYNCLIQTLPATAQSAIIEGKLKRVVGVYGRLVDTRGLKWGDALDNLFEMRDRTTEKYGEPTELRAGMDYTTFESSFEREGQFYIQQTYPLPATVLGMVLDVEVGDDSD